MSRRKNHLTKTPNEQQEYVDTVVRGKNEPTLETLPQGDETGNLALSQEFNWSKGTYQQNKIEILWSKIQEKLISIIISSIATIVIAILGWYLKDIHDKLYSLNRELGEIKADLKSVRETEIRLGTSIEKNENKIEKIETRIDDLTQTFFKSNSATLVKPVK